MMVTELLMKEKLYLYICSIINLLVVAALINLDSAGLIDG